MPWQLFFLLWAAAAVACVWSTYVLWRARRASTDRQELIRFRSLVAQGALTVNEARAEMKRVPIHPNYDRALAPIGWVALPERLFTSPSLGRMLIAPGGRAEEGQIVEVQEFGLIPSQTFDTRSDAVPIKTADDVVVGHVRMSESMVFRLGELKDLELRPIVQDATNAVVGYQVINRTTQPVETSAEEA